MRSTRIPGAALRWLAVAATPALLVACGGGSGDEPPASATPAFEVAAAVTALATGPADVFTVSGTMAGQPATLKVEYAPMPDTSFDTFGNVNAMRQTATLTTGGVSTTTHESHYLNLASHTYYGMTDADGMHRASTMRGTYPVSAHVGDHGLLYDATHHDEAGHHGGAMTDSRRSRMTWSLEPGTGPDDAYLCMNVELQTMQGTPTGEAQQHCYRIDASGKPLGLRIRMTSPASGTVEFR